ncbi:beta-glucosidase 26-like [Panicum virgatum]|uniref:beta-glucosidase 26-like n=1 Tax=Panicum virgatum TaxID=38727 RepID=UPI0019D6851F|nr:beta-glucosidase 26-like [Panicum virgatum]
MQEIVKDRLPLFSDEESRMVKCSIDYVGINHYTSYYMKDPGTRNLMPVSYQDDGHVGFVYERNGVPIAAHANSYWLYIVPWGINKASLKIFLYLVSVTISFHHVSFHIVPNNSLESMHVVFEFRL